MLLEIRKNVAVFLIPFHRIESFRCRTKNMFSLYRRKIFRTRNNLFAFYLGMVKLKQ